MKNEKGFTLIEMLVVFTAFCMLMAFLPLGFKTVLQYKYMDTRIQRLEWEIFNSQLKRETRLSMNMTIEKGKLLIQNNGETVVFEKYGSSIRRRVNFSGHEIILQNVASVVFDPLPNGYSISIKDLNRAAYSADIRAFVEQGAGNEE